LLVFTPMPGSSTVYVPGLGMSPPKFTMVNVAVRSTLHDTRNARNGAGCVAVGVIVMVGVCVIVGVNVCVLVGVEVRVAVAVRVAVYVDVLEGV
jgi:hypothetical protein